MNKKLLFSLLIASALLVIIPSVSAYSYIGSGYYDSYEYTKTVREDPWGKTVNIQKNTPYSTMNYYRSEDYYPGYRYIGYSPYYGYSYSRPSYSSSIYSRPYNVNHGYYRDNYFDYRNNDYYGYYRYGF
ncbi:hypothetical protein COU60_03615 [Candidatus Pacearchaeota archaeon CG10_big_fil_rev_8_21_14_0_10_34_76]|nr:MAG: hypothetical protein COU60_03615 [Candidatus Pacearchaeota archaeon CG10_big_fil_rev_8_21_14_0_10_34_76]